MLILWGKFSMLWCFTYLLPLLNFQYTGILLPCTSVQLGIYIRSYGSISGLNAIRILSLTTYYRSLLLLKILFFKPLLEILISESPQHTTKVNPWWFDCFSCGFSVRSVSGIGPTWMYTCVFLIRSFGIAQISICTLIILIVNW